MSMRTNPSFKMSLLSRIVTLWPRNQNLVITMPLHPQARSFLDQRQAMGVQPVNVLSVEAYATRLQAEGVPTILKVYEGMIHGFLGPQANADMAGALREAFST